MSWFEDIVNVIALLKVVGSPDRFEVESTLSIVTSTTRVMVGDRRVFILPVVPVPYHFIVCRRKYG